MQSHSLAAKVDLASSRTHCRQQNSRRCVTTRAQGGPSNPIGIHAQVWVGDWSKDEAVKAISGTKKAGYDLIERAFLGMLLSFLAIKSWQSVFSLKTTNMTQIEKCSQWSCHSSFLQTINCKLLTRRPHIMTLKSEIIKNKKPFVACD